jgi:hypothetical protein
MAFAPQIVFHSYIYESRSVVFKKTAVRGLSIVLCRVRSALLVVIVHRKNHENCQPDQG